MIRSVLLVVLHLLRVSGGVLPISRRAGSRRFRFRNGTFG